MTPSASTASPPLPAPSVPPRAARLELEDVSKRYGATVAVDGVSLSLAEGEFLTFLGQSGSGKTTVLKLVAGFESCDGGTVRIAGTDVATRPPRERDVGMVFQQYALFPHLTVADNIAYGLRRRKWPAARRQARVAEMLELVRLGDLGHRYPRQLSGGQQQRVAVARALAFEPQLLLMDEPLGALDRALRLDLEHELRRIHRSTGCSVVYVTHDRDEALALSDRIAVFHAGRLVGLDAPERLYDRPPTAYVARLLTDANLVALPSGTRRVGDEAEAEISGRTVRLRAVAEPGDDARLAIPRTAIDVTGREGASALRLAARVEDVVFLGEYAKVDLHTAELGALTAHVPLREPLGCSPGDEIAASVDLRRCLVVI